MYSRYISSLTRFSPLSLIPLDFLVIFLSSPFLVFISRVSLLHSLFHSCGRVVFVLLYLPPDGTSVSSYRVALPLLFTVFSSRPFFFFPFFFLRTPDFLRSILLSLIRTPDTFFLLSKASVPLASLFCLPSLSSSVISRAIIHREHRHRADDFYQS